MLVLDEVFSYFLLLFIGDLSIAILNSFSPAVAKASKHPVTDANNAKSKEGNDLLSSRFAYRAKTMDARIPEIPFQPVIDALS